MEFTEDMIWLKLENRVRFLVKDILSTSLSHIQLIEADHKTILMKNSKTKRRLRNMENQLTSFASKIPNTESINDMLIESSVKMQSTEIKIKKNKEALICEIEQLASKINEIGREVHSLENQLHLEHDESKNLNNTLYAMKSSLEKEIHEAYRAVKDKKHDDIFDHLDLKQRFAKVEKKIKYIEASLCDVEVLSKTNENKIIEIDNEFEQKVQETRNEVRSYEQCIKDINIEVSHMERKLADKLKSIREEQSRLISDASRGILKDRDDGICYWFDFVLTEARYKQRITELKKKIENSKEVDNQNEIPVNNIAEAIKLDSKCKDRKRKMKKDFSCRSLEEKVMSSNGSSSRFIPRSNSAMYYPRSSCTSDNFELVRSESKLPLKLLWSSVPIFKIPTRISRGSEETVTFDIHEVVSRSHQLFLPLSDIAKNRFPEEINTTEKVKVLSSESSATNYEALEMNCSFQESPRANSNNKSKRYGKDEEYGEDSEELKTRSILNRDYEPIINDYQDIIRDYQSKINEYQLKLNDYDSKLNDYQNINQDLYEQIKSTQQELIDLKDTFSSQRLEFSAFSENISQSIYDLQEHQEQSLNKVNLYIEQNVKDWVLDSISSSYQTTMRNLLETSQKFREDIESISNDQKTLKEVLHQSVNDFNTSTSTKRREIIDIKLRLKESNKQIAEHSEQFFIFRSEIDKIHNDSEKIIQILRVQFLRQNLRIYFGTAVFV